MFLDRVIGRLSFKRCVCLDRATGTAQHEPVLWYAVWQRFDQLLACLWAELGHESLLCALSNIFHKSNAHLFQLAAQAICHTGQALNLEGADEIQNLLRSQKEDRLGATEKTGVRMDFSFPGT